jgi:RNA polymerase sigma-70 factor (ECF subfamily)
MPPTDAEQARWFVEEMQPHERSLRSYLNGSFPAVRDVDDVVQESFLRAWKTKAKQPINSAKGFLFKVARHLAIDVIRREKRSPIEAVGSLEAIDVSEDKPIVSSTVSRNEKIQLLVSAIDSLPPKCRQVVILRKLKGVPVRQIAEELQISEKGVEIQLTRGIARCREYLAKRGIRSLFDDET